MRRHLGGRRGPPVKLIRYLALEAVKAGVIQAAVSAGEKVGEVIGEQIAKRVKPQAGKGRRR